MKRKDDLLRLAFGELADDAARSLEAGANDAERAEVETFRALRDDLHRLPSPPPDNLSAERLRAAILDRELKTRRPFNWGAALFAPVALAALAAVFVLPRLRPRPEPQIVSLNEASVAPRQDFDLDRAAGFRFRPSAPVARVQAQVLAPKPQTLAKIEETTPEREKNVRRRGTRHRHSVEPVEEPQIDPQLVAQSFSQPNSEMEGQTVASTPIHAPQEASALTIAPPPSAVVVATPGETGKTETVVIVSTKRDLETGALAATEREASSVLVGG